MDRLDRAPARIRARYTEGSDGDGRLTRDRAVVIPWLDRTRHLDGTKILEVGCGTGASTVALAEQGAELTAVDVNESLVNEACARCAAHGLAVDLIVANATELAAVAPSVDWVIFWAVLEHMTIDERLASLAGAWRLLPPGGLLTVIETPNRLWLTDSHTSLLPYFNWLPDDLAFTYSRFSPRAGFNDVYREASDAKMHEFLRRGRGVSFHEFELGLGRLDSLDVVSSMQLERRRRNPLRATGWRVSPSGRYERLLHAQTPAVPRAFLQPFLYLTLRKG